MRARAPIETLAAGSTACPPEFAMPVVTPTRLPIVQTLLQHAPRWRGDAALAAVVAAALCTAGVVIALGPLPVQALLGCA
jgi:hypothetical protein